MKNSIRFPFRISAYYKILSEEEFKRIFSIIKQRKTKDVHDRIILNKFDLLKSISISDLKFSKKIKKINLKKQLIHGDIHPDNVIFKKHKVSAIIDFNSLRKGFPIEDIAFSSFRFSCFHSYNINKIKKDIQQYIDIYKLYNNIEEKEVELLPLFLRHTFFQRLSYIIRKRYFDNSNIWIKDLEKQLFLINLVKKVWEV